MTKVTYVNVSGQPVDPAYLPRALPKTKGPALKRVEEAAKAKQHHGFEVIGISEEVVRAAASDWAEKRAVAKLPKVEFDREAFINKTRPKRAIRRVFHIPEAAEQAAGMLRAGGVGTGFRSSRS